MARLCRSLHTWIVYTLGLVAQTLLVAVFPHALAPLMLVDLRFAAFLNGTHMMI